MKKLYVKTYGCQMNFYDSERMTDILSTVGYAPTESYEGADMVVLNTCHIREKAAEKMYAELGRIKKANVPHVKAGKKMLTAIAGCVGQAEGKEIFRRAPMVDIVVGPQAYHTLPDLIMQAERDGRAINLDFPEEPKFDALPEPTQTENRSAFLSVQEGCDKFCTFCVVPYTRGAEYSRAVLEIYREALKMVDRGVVEITLLGQNVNAYHGEGPDGEVWSLARLIRHLSEIPGLERIRYTTSHPRDMHEDLYQAHADIDKLMPYLHLPVQAGSDRILQKMNRKHTAKEYLQIIEKLRKLRPDIAFSGDFIVGFPGETDQDFEDTMALVREVGYASAYSFKYSPRPGTPAADHDAQVPEEVKSERLQRLQALLNEQQVQFNRRCVGLAMSVLLERPGKYPGQLIGKSPYMQSVHVHDAEHLQGQIVDLTITEAQNNSLRGELVEDQLSVIGRQT